MGTSAVSLPTMGGLQHYNVKYTSLDAYHDVSEINPIHLSHPWNKCTMDQTKAGQCTLNITTVSMPVYSMFDGLDTGFYETSSFEIRTKMLARLYIWQTA